MINLLRFFIRYHLLILFLLLQSVCMYLLYAGSVYHEGVLVQAGNRMAGSVYAAVNSFTGYLRLGQVNDSLAHEVAVLRSRLPQSVYSNTAPVLPRQDTTGNTIQVFNYRPARVIRNTVNRAENIIYIDKGSLHGIRPQMGVVNKAGVVGQVIQVTPHYAAVMSLLHRKFTISAKLKNTGYFGNLNWDGVNTHTAILSEIPKHVQLQAGDTVVSSGYSQLFPVGVMVGTVKEVNRRPDSNFADVTVRLAVNFHKLDYVYVIENLHRQELMQLDSLTQNRQP